ncbi:MAG: PQQ-binding-like beta-propeller repeat protein [Betaproteobacteria bacterium]|nr:PQQ-binding-like beta-propeller repeat protein [Betaproteobacteria bacterium]
MKRTSPTSLILTKMAFVLGMGFAMTTVNAALTDIASAPMANTASSVVKPNLMFLLDASGSMNWDFMPDSVDFDPACKSTGSSLTNCSFADPPHNSAQFNGIYYNPTITYTPAVNYDGTSFPSYTTWTAVPNDAFGIQFSGTIDLTTAYPDTVWCNTNSPTTSDLTAPFASGVCKRPIQAGVWTYPNGTYNRLRSAAGTLNPYYYTVSSLAWCSSANASGFGTGTCQAKKTATYQYPKYGTGSDGFTRTDIVPGTASYPRAASRTDCSGAVGATGCSYAQEMTNFANWYAYYRTRMQMMKSAAGLAFKQVTDSFRVGFITINPGSPVASAKFLPMADFTAGAGGQKNNWYTKFYAQNPNLSTPLREALSRVGRYYAHVTTGINNGITDDPMQYSCQQNFTIMSTDGFWNGNAGQKLDGSAIGNQDSDPTTAPRPLLDGSFQLTAVTSNSTYTQQICTGSATVFGATPCGCSANFSRVKQQTSSSISTVVSRDGVVLSTTPSTTTTYQDITACNAVVTTAVTPTTKVDEQAVNGNATTTFAAVNGISAGDNQAGTCAANFGRIKRRTTTATSTVVTTGGVAAAPVLGATYAFADVGSCVALTNTVVTQFTVVDEQTLVANATSTFGTINGVAAGANQAGVCGAGQARIKRRTTTYNQTVVTVGSTAGAPTTSGTAYAFSDPGSCVNLTSTTTTPVTETAQWVSSANGTNLPSAFAAAFAGSPNPQTTYTCTIAGRTLKLQRVMGYNRIVTTIGAGAPTTTYSGTTSGPTFTIAQSCTVGAKTANPTTTVNGATSAPVVTGAPVAAATSSSSSVTSNTTTGGPSPAASTSVTGATTSTSTGAAITSADFTITPNPKSVVTNTSTSGPLGYPDTLADVAQYYYMTDLRAPGSLGAAVSGTQLDVGTTNNVPGQPGTDPQNDSASWQHMTTFTLGLGVDGTLTYASDYRTNPTGDFLAIKNGTMNWPQPVADTVSAVDDLWHAAVDGRGTYFSAKDPAQLVSGLSNALSGVTATTGSAAAAATSNLEPVAGDNFAYVASYETVRWNGDVEARTIDLSTGAVSAPPSIWSAQAQLDTLTNATTPGGNNRSIKRFNSSSTNKLQDFAWANLTATEQAYFNAAWIGTGGAALSQWGSLTATQQTAAAGSNLVSFIRGDSSFEAQASVAAGNQLYRDRQHVLGDVVDGAPVYVKKISAGYADAGFASPAGANFKECVNTAGVSCSGIYSGSRDPVNVVAGVDVGSARSANVYIAANDGMLHALNGDTGTERWAYIPNILIPNLYRLADKDYANRHQYYVDGSPTVGDVYDPVAAKWKTILVGGLASGGRSFYALDVTDPATPIGLWEFNVRATASCPSATVLGTDKDDCDLGLSYGNPIITKLAPVSPATNGKWVVVVTSGYNNVSPGDGKGYVYVLDPITGVILKKIQAANASQFLSPGSTATPLGLARINNWVDDTNVDNTTLRVYGGDLQGYLWRFNLDTATAYAIARYTDPSGVAQPVTTKPELGDVNGVAMTYVGTGRYLGTSDLPSTQVQTIYGIKDATNGVAPSTPINARGTTVVAQTLTNGTSGTGAGIRTATSNAVDLTAKNGWRADLPNSGERVNVDPKLQLGTLIVGSNIPASSACTSGGTSYLNFLDYKTGGYVQSSGNTLAGVLVGNSLVVGISIVRLPNNKTVAIVTTSDNKYPNLAPPFSSPSPTGRRSSFRELQ